MKENGVSIEEVLIRLEHLCDVCKGLADLKAFLGRMPNSELRCSLEDLVDDIAKTSVLQLLRLELTGSVRNATEFITTLIRMRSPEMVEALEAELAVTLRLEAEKLETVDPHKRKFFSPSDLDDDIPI